MVFIGANDPQNFMDGSTSLTYGTPAWNAAYAKRVGAFMAEAAVASGARVLWVGMPPMADPGAQRPDGEPQRHRPEPGGAAPWCDVLRVVAGALQPPGSATAAFLPNASGSEVQVRDPDGTHLAGPGAQRLSQAAIAFMGHEWGLVL